MKIAILGWTAAVGDTRPVLFTLIAERYERRSLGITSNLVFSEWEKIFANCDDTLGPSGTGSDPFANWLRCPHRDLSIRSRGGP